MITVPTPPDAVFVWSGQTEEPHTAHRSEGLWEAGGAVVRTVPVAGGLDVRVRSSAPLSKIALRWSRGLPGQSLVLGDHWERSYGDLRWEPPRPDRVLPWYWMATGPSGRTRGAGVQVRPSALCSWTADTSGTTLWLDVRSGAEALLPTDRELHAATVVEWEATDVDAFAALRELCAALCPDPSLPSTPVFGSNNWYYAYGENFDADAVLRDADVVIHAANGHPVRPYCVVDAGWSEGGTAPGGPWDQGHGSFSDMAKVASRITAAGARPGLWYRPLLSREPVVGTRRDRLDGSWPLDPSRPEVLEQVTRDLRRFTEWGFDLVKHDFSTYDVFGRFLSHADVDSGAPRWSFADRTRTTAEVLVEFYRTIAQASPALVLGCNTVGHLAAGFEHVHRTGDDTSGRQWERTRRMGVNTLAFRLAQHRRFYVNDPDCVASTPATPWEKNRQFLDLVAATGNALFVSVDPRTLTPEVAADLRRAAAVALGGGLPGGAEPLDWQSTTAPRLWQTAEGRRTYDWEHPWGADVQVAGI
ncbi:hypothetical protein ACIP79_03065 [Streptomyces sp. NPDC088747]|uniref:hypothetical protein n=1 Tax=Streptomyces sp. NPDC088747 TaxID=3365886 RepID=UPI0037FF56E6